MTCDLCQREVDGVTRHHLVPRARRKRGVEGKNDGPVTVRLCKPCHGHVHSVLTETEIWKGYFTVERLLSHKKIQKFVKWLKDKPPDFHVTRKRLKKRR